MMSTRSWLPLCFMFPARLSIAMLHPATYCHLQAVRQPGEAVMRHYDYGTSCRTLLDTPRPCNQAVYGQLVPPQYNLSAIDNSLVLFTGEAGG